MTPAKYRAFARECLELAEETEEQECARALFEVCKTLLKTALRLEEQRLPDISLGPGKADCPRG
jgi:hypothetical protein